MRVSFSDPQGRRLLRAGPYLPPLGLFALACAAPYLSTSAALLGAVGAVGLFHVAGLIPVRQGALRQAELECGPGYVRITKAGLRSQRIDARMISGATTSRTSRGILFTLEHRRRDQPLLLEVESEADAEKVRHALGIGHGGFGSVGWRTAPSSAAKTAWTGRFITAAIALMITALGLLVSPEAAGIAAVFTTQFAFITMILGFVGWLARPPMQSIVMTSAGLRIQTTMGWFTVPYAHILGIEHQRDVLVFRVPPPYNVVHVPIENNLRGSGLGQADRDALIKQILSAAARARGLGVEKNDISGRLDMLRRNGESPRAWLSRLDMAGQMLESSSAGYRGHTLDAEDLWTILEDPEAEADLRAAAARVLRHLGQPEARVRIDAAVAAVRDESLTKKLRIAIRDDVEGASHELAMLDAQEAQEPPRAMYVR
ncbi:MAG: hypothetical protein JST00_32330 [Deltaproteobacteria bacterium]|nr:hypothetical protein [Deltaproteobacteria bacterium]